MVKQAKQAYLDAIRGRYTKAKRTDKAKILDEFCAVRLQPEVCLSGY